jgi:hypothetical protein
MPCRCDDYPIPSSDQDRLNDELKRAIEKYKAEANKVTQLLCELTARIPDKYIKAQEELDVWVNAHANLDKQRKLQEEKRKLAKKKELKASINALQKQLKDLD